MKAEDVMTRRVVACRADTELAHAARLMWDNDCGAIPVVDSDDHVVGILTDRDACMSAYFQGRSLRDLRASTCMASQVVTCRPADSAVDVARLMAEHRVRRIPVTDDSGRLIGIVSLGDLLGAAARAGGKKKKLIQEAAIESLTRICERDAREVQPALPAGKSEGARSRKRAGKTQ